MDVTEDIFAEDAVDVIGVVVRNATGRATNLTNMKNFDVHLVSELATGSIFAINIS